MSIKKTKNRLQVNLTINGETVDGTQNAVFPIKFSSLLDEQLDFASLSLLKTKTPIIHPLTKISVNVQNDDFAGRGIEFDMLVSGDDSEEKIVGGQRWNHQLMLIEETKTLEGFICRSHGYVNSLGRFYVEE